MSVQEEETCLLPAERGRYKWGLQVFERDFPDWIRETSETYNSRSGFLFQRLLNSVFIFKKNKAFKSVLLSNAVKLRGGVNSSYY